MKSFEEPLRGDDHRWSNVQPFCGQGPKQGSPSSGNALGGCWKKVPSAAQIEKCNLVKRFEGELVR